MNAWMLATSAALLIAATGARGEAPGDFAYRQPLATPGDRAFYRVDLADALYDGAAHPDLSDLRVFNAGNGVVPYAFVPAPPPVAAPADTRPLAFFPLTVDTSKSAASEVSIRLHGDASGTTADIRSRDGAPVSGPRIVGYLVDAGAVAPPLVAPRLPLTEAAAINARVAVDASDDLDHWRTIVASAPLLALEYNGRRLARERIEFSPLRARYLRLTWLSGAPPALTAVDGEAGAQFVERARRVREAPGVAEGGDAFVFDLKAVLPVERLTLALPEVNSVAPVVWETRIGADDAWWRAGSSIAYRLRQEGGEITNADYALAPTAMRYVRARIDPKAGGVGAGVPVLKAGWRAREIVFAARGAAPFELAYGSRSASAGALPMALLVPGYTADGPLPANVGEATLAATPSTVNRRALREPLDVRRWLLWGSLVAASLLLGYMARRLARQVRGPGGAAGPH